VVLTLDGVGEWCTTSAGIGRGNQLSIERKLHFPHSIGFLISCASAMPARHHCKNLNLRVKQRESFRPSRPPP
jgi:predicted NodU family carbamoyl transferase